MSELASVREVAAEDLAEVIGIARRTQGAPEWSDQVYGELIGPPAQIAVSRKCLILEVGGRTIGFGIVTVLAAVMFREAELESIVIDRNSQRQGFGGVLLTGLLDWAAAQEAECTRLEVRASNKVALSLYERHGFVREGMRRSYYRDPAEDAVLMGRGCSDTFA